MATDYTPNYNLDLYASSDKPNLRDQYNAAMGKIDTQMKRSADDVTNANANVLTLQTRMTEAQKNISALESTVETHGTQITGVQKTADDALSLAQTNETDIASTQADVTSLTGRVTTVESTANKNKIDVASLGGRMAAAETNITDAQADVNQKAPINHASTVNTYGQGSPTSFGHLKVTDTAGTTAASTGTAASPAGVQEAIKEWLVPRVVELAAPSSGNWASGTLHQCFVYGIWKVLKFTFNLQLSGTNNPDYVTVATCDQLGIPKPSSDRLLNGSIWAHARVSGITYISSMHVRANGDIQVDGWNTLNNARTDWTEVGPIQVMIDYRDW